MTGLGEVRTSKRSVGPRFKVAFRSAKDGANRLEHSEFLGLMLQDKLSIRHERLITLRNRSYLLFELEAVQVGILYQDVQADRLALKRL